MAYLDKLFTDNIDENQVKTIFELGSRDLIDAFQLCNYYKNSSVYAFECNPDCLIECENNLLTATEYEKQHVHLIKNAISDIDVGEELTLNYGEENGSFSLEIEK